MLDLIPLLVVGGAFALMVASPGPATLAVATVSMSAGRRAGLLFGIGLSVGHVFWGCVAATGLGAVLQTVSHALVILKLSGGLYLLWLAYGSLRSSVRTASRPAAPSPDKGWLRRGLVLNLSNPKVVVAWMATLSLGAGPDRSAALIAAATALCIALSFAINTIYALAFSTRGAMTVYGGVRRWIEGMVATLFAVMGIGLIRSAFARSP